MKRIILKTATSVSTRSAGFRAFEMIKQVCLDVDDSADMRKWDDGVYLFLEIPVWTGWDNTVYAAAKRTGADIVATEVVVVKSHVFHGDPDRFLALEARKDGKVKRYNDVLHPLHSEITDSLLSAADPVEAYLGWLWNTDRHEYERYARMWVQARIEDGWSVELQRAES
jgi:DNA-binding cell septation regulator SpoVG